MIRSIRIPLRGPAMVQAGDGGSAGMYSFDADGLSNDPRLAYYLQSLTAQQLQNALDGKDPLPDLQAINDKLLTGEGLPCGTAASGDPDCSGGQPRNFAGLPIWGWVAIGAGILLVTRSR